MPKAAIYIRVSTAMQQDKESLTVQRNDLVNHCEHALGISDYEIFEDAGYSAGSTDRPAYQKMMLRLRSGEFTHLLVWKIDRISRNIIDFTDMYNDLKSMDIVFISKHELFDTSTIIGQALLKIILIFAELERKNAAERSKAVLLSKASEGEFTGHRIPFGYRRNSTDKTYSIEDMEARLIHIMFDLYEGGRTTYAIAKYLNSLPKTERIKDIWLTPTIDRILDNIFYTGVLRYNYMSFNTQKQRLINASDEWVLVEDNHPAIISREQFQKCQEICNQRKEVSFQIRRPLFADLLICRCGRSLDWKKENDRGFSSPAVYWCHDCHPDVKATDLEIGSFIINYLLNLLNTWSSVAPDTAAVTIKNSLLRGLKPVKDLDNLAQICLALKGPDTDTAARYRQLRFQLQSAEHKRSRFAQTSSKEIEILDKEISRLRKELSSLETVNNNEPVGPAYMHKCRTFYLKHALSHQESIDFHIVRRDIPFYELKHFLADVIAQIHVQEGNIAAITFRSDQEPIAIHQFVN